MNKEDIIKARYVYNMLNVVCMRYFESVKNEWEDYNSWAYSAVNDCVLITYSFINYHDELDFSTVIVSFDELIKFMEHENIVW